MDQRRRRRDRSGEEYRKKEEEEGIKEVEKEGEESEEVGEKGGENINAGLRQRCCERRKWKEEYEEIESPQKQVKRNARKET